MDDVARIVRKSDAGRASDLAVFVEKGSGPADLRGAVWLGFVRRLRRRRCIVFCCGFGLRSTDPILNDGAG